VLGIGRISPERRGLAAGGVFVASATISLAVGPWARIVDGTPFGGRPRLSDARVEALAAAVAAVPSGAPVSTSNSVGAHVSDRKDVYTVPMIGRAEWIVVDVNDPYVVTPDSPILTFHPKAPQAFAAKLEQDPGWTKVREESGVLVYRRTR
jgi:hypothetical protein